MKKYLIRFLILILIVYIALQVVPYGKSHKTGPFRKEGEVLMVAHGGCKELNPENTWMAYDYAFSHGADVLEIDCQLTKDGKLATVHNLDISDYTDLNVSANEMTLAELEQLNFGLNFVDLDGNMPYKDANIEDYNRALAPANVEEMFQKYGKDIAYLVEIKDTQDYKPTVDALIALIDQYDMKDYVCIASFSKEVMDYVHSVVDETYITLHDESSSADFIIANLAGYGYFLDFRQSGLSIPTEKYNIPLNSKYSIYKIHKNDTFVYYWTINTEEEMRECIENGADGIVTDRIDLLEKVLIEMGYK